MYVSCIFCCPFVWISQSTTQAGNETWGSTAVFNNLPQLDVSIAHDLREKINFKSLKWGILECTLRPVDCPIEPARRVGGQLSRHQGFGADIAFSHALNR
jgi:hypothetical protein